MLLGRDTERALIEDVAGGGVLVLRGEAGIGKSALLEDAAGRAENVLRARGVEAESGLAYAGLHQLLRPLLDGLDRLPDGQAEALRRACGLAAGEADPFLVGLGTVGLLSGLCVVDDAQWLDRPSLDALLFAARRVEGERVALLIAARELDAAGLPELRLEGLGDDAAAELLAAGGAAPAVSERLLAVARGNPLALAELPAALTADQLAGREPLGEPVPVSERLARAFLGPVHGLDTHARRLLELAAAEDGGDLAVVLRAARGLGVDVSALDDLEAAGLVAADGPRIAFRHPLVRAAVYRGAGFKGREAAHLALAEAVDADRRAWHKAAASPVPDAAVADELERAAGRAGAGAAALGLERAARLSADDAARGRRLLAAAEAHWTAGDAGRTGWLVVQAEPSLADPSLRSRAAMLRAAHELERGRADDAYEVLVAGAQETEGRTALELLVRAGEACAVTARVDWAHELVEIAAARPRGDGDKEHCLRALLTGTARMLAGDHESGVPELERARGLATPGAHPRDLISASLADAQLGDIGAARARRARAVDRLRTAGADGELPLALGTLAGAEVWIGRLGAAREHATDALRRARERGQRTQAAFALAALARADALLGREDDCRAHADEALEHHLALPGALALLALGQLELGLGRAEAALGHLTQIFDEGAGLAHPLVALYAAPELVEAAVRCGRADLAGPALERFGAWAGRVPARWPAAVAARLRALVADPAEAHEHFEAALRAHELPLEHARTQLLYGAHLRRLRRRADARPHLRAALATFERLGAAPWAERAGAELRASGETARRRNPSTIDDLTPQELQIARYVSEGATNREVAGRLFLSVRTVEYHLRKVFTKLGITSRAELGRALPALA